jgi:hypothetical protein
MITHSTLREWMKEFRISQSYFRSYITLIATGKPSKRLEQLIRTDSRHRDLFTLIVDELLCRRRFLIRAALHHGISI